MINKAKKRLKEFKRRGAPAKVVNEESGKEDDENSENYEDDDFCLRARLAGFKLAVANNCFVYHHGSKTFAENKVDHKELMSRNRHYFYAKAIQKFLLLCV